MNETNLGKTPDKALAARKLRLLPLLCAALLAAGCATSPTQQSLQNLPPVENKTLDGMQDQVVAESQRLAANHAELVKKIVTPPAPAVLPMAPPKLDPLESHMINIKMYNASVGELAAALADQAHLNLIVDPAVLALDKRAGLFLHNVTLREAIDEILRAFDLAGQVKGHTLRIDLTEERTFSLDFLNTSMSMELSAGGNVFGSGNSGGSSGGSSGSSGSNALRGDVTLSGGNGAKTDPYDQVESAVKTILGDNKKTAKAGDQTATTDEADDKQKESIYSLNKLSGTLYVKARPSQVRAIESFLSRTQKSLSRQVQIDAQLIDVQLSDSFNLGVDWNLLRNNVAASIGASPMTLSAATASLATANTALRSRSVIIPAQLLGSQNGGAGGISYQGDTSGIVLKALRAFGNVKVLSNPSVQVRNGTPALLSVGTSSRYIASSSATVTNPGGGASTTTSTVQTDSVFSGIMMGVVPYIRDDGKVELLVHPMQTDVDANSLQLVNLGNGNQITLPVVNYKGMTTTLNVNDGDTVMIGGLIDQRSTRSNSGLPGAADAPLLGWAFDNQSKTNNNREMVMVLRVRVL